ncbi:MAG: hypothetical protein HYR91_13375, partial [Flavobacteriia bacterium]|nr:hypothetical protein [Flavobacteriia bacterium]
MIKKKKKYLFTSIIWLLIVLSNFSFGQINYYSDCIKGGVVGDGLISWIPAGIGNITLSIPVGSTIKKALFFSNLYKWEGNMIPATDKIIEINGIPLILSESYNINNSFYCSTLNSYISTISIDITNFIDPNITTYTINSFTNLSPVESPMFSDYYILVLYENSFFNINCVDVFINNLDTDGIISYSLNSSNVIDTNSNVGLEVYTSSICDLHDDWYDVLINSNSIGEIGGKEDNTTVYCAGVTGSFGYNNGMLVGVGNDTPDNFMNGLDAIANIQPYLTNTNSLDLTFQYVSNLSPKSNVINQVYLTYTTPCDTFSVSVPNDTIVCKGSQLQLNVSGGQNYEWYPSTGLSCTNCPNPIFTADSTMNYTVRIWNNDSCSVVRPIKIIVNPLPTFNHLTITPTNCGTTNGKVAITPNSNV